MPHGIPNDLQPIILITYLLQPVTGLPSTDSAMAMCDIPLSGTALPHPIDTVIQMTDLFLRQILPTKGNK